MSPLLEATGLVAGYGRAEVLHGIDLRVEPGEVVALLGANGAGKTTTLLALSGVIGHSGAVSVLGSTKQESLHARVKRGMGFLPQERGVVSSLSVADNLRLANVSRARALELSPALDVIWNTKAGRLSGGEQQILALTRVIASEPMLLLADELSFGLAPVVVGRMLRLIRLAADRGTGVLLVEQYARQALHCADRGYVLHRGRIVMAGSAEELLANMESVEHSYLRGHDRTDESKTRVRVDTDKE